MNSIKIGRSTQCDIIINDSYISGIHAEIKLVSSGRYVYTDMSRNGSVLNGRIIGHNPIEITYGTPILLAGKIPLPWEQIQMKLDSVNPFDNHTNITTDHSQSDYNNDFHYYDNEDLGCGWMVLCFLIPLVGLVLYFAWDNKKPVAAKTAGQVALISVGIDIVISILASL